MDRRKEVEAIESEPFELFITFYLYSILSLVMTYPLVQELLTLISFLYSIGEVVKLAGGNYSRMAVKGGVISIT